MLGESNASSLYAFASMLDTSDDSPATVGDNLSPSFAASNNSLQPFMESVTLAAVLLLLILACVIGNLLVIVAIACERDLRGRPQYYLIFSLAVADLIVSLYFF
ncbi:unnamed protein product [Haemonchus placei]|uniref:G_PROTEIN_RECEP_F1_2 domain-containing protein n=1 Tax=Haemonchus placei TaxID=6290 RepID=A0A0N4WMC4_HAEPC|nr:unnamed protein product [Haemonchus placei]